LDHYDNYSLLVAVILSAQTTDGKVGRWGKRVTKGGGGGEGRGGKGEGGKVGRWGKRVTKGGGGGEGRGGKGEGGGERGEPTSEGSITKQ
jgi:hypothetical protein